MSLVQRISALASAIAADMKQTGDTIIAVNDNLQGQVDGKVDIIGSGNASFRRVRDVVRWEQSASNIAGDLVITTNLQMTNVMTRVHIQGYNYLDANESIDLKVGFYAASGPAFYRIGAKDDGTFPVAAVRLGVNASGRVVIVVTSGAGGAYWQYPKIAVDVITGHSNPGNPAFQGWSAAISTTPTTGVGTVTTVAVKADSPTTHGHALTDSNITGVLPIAQIPVANPGIISSTNVVRADDPRLSNARTPTGHTHATTDITGLTATAAELNKLDGATVTVTEINYSDGVTSNIQTQLNGKSATTHGHALTDANITGVLPMAQTPLTAILQAVYPVGALYISYVSTSPATTFGFGTWVQITDRMLIGVGSNARWNSAGDVGGSETVALTQAQIPDHSHALQLGTGAASGTGDGAARASTSMDGNFRTGSSVHVSGGYGSAEAVASVNVTGNPHENMPPFMAVYIWRRTA